MSTEININKNIYNSDGTVNNNRTVDLDGNTLEFNNGNIGVNITPTMPLQIQGTAIPSTNENLFRATVSDVVGAHFTIQNGTTGDGVFVPKVLGRQTFSSNEVAVNYAGVIDSTQDSGTNPVTVFQAHLHTLASVVTRPLFQWKNWATNMMTMLANGNVGIGTTTPTEKLEVSGKTKTTTFQMTTAPTAGYVLTSDASGNGSWNAPPVSSGVFGIADSSGTYTYYTTLTLAMTAAVAGQTIEMFADVTTGSNVSVNLKNGVNINGNGHTYSYTNSLGVPFIDNGASVNCQITNLKISRVSSLSSGSNILLTGSSIIDFSGSYIYRNVLTDNYACIEAGSQARVFNAYCVSEWGRGMWFAGASSLIDNCYSQNVQGGGQGIISAGNVTNSTGLSNNLMGIDITSTTGLAINSIGISVSSVGVRGNTVNCTGISTSGNGIGAQTITSHRNSTAISSSGGAFSTGSSSSTNYNCTYETNSGTFGASSDGGQYFNCSISVLSGTANAIISPSRVLNCMVRVSNTSAFCLYSVIARTVNYLNNCFVGATTPVSTVTITQGTTNTHDNQGNILL